MATEDPDSGRGSSGFFAVFVDDRRYDSVVVIYEWRRIPLCSRTHQVFGVREI
jgi:hypothetical protein